MVIKHDIFISYAHIDNRPVGQEKWIETFHERLAVLLAQFLGDDPEIWRDLKLQGNDYFDETIVDQLPGTALLVSVLSPRYVGSEWCTKEVRRFLEAANQTGGVSVGGKSRIFKVVKTLVPLEEQPSELQGMLGYQFLKSTRSRAVPANSVSVLAPTPNNCIGPNSTIWLTTSATF